MCESVKKALQVLFFNHNMELWHTRTTDNDLRRAFADVEYNDFD
jgi:hypothetical protein